MTDEMADGIEPRVDRSRIGQRTRKPPLQLARPCARHRSVHRREQRRCFFPRGGAHEFEARTARGIDEETSTPRLPRRPPAF